MNGNILVIDNGAAREYTKATFIPHGTNDHHIMLWQLSGRYDLYAGNGVTIPTNHFAATICQCQLEDRLHLMLPRPVIGLPDNDSMYTLNTLAGYDGIIATTDIIVADCKVVGVPYIKAHPINFSHLSNCKDNFETNQLLSRSIFSNHPWSNVFCNDILRIIDDVDIMYHIYYYPNALQEVSRLWDYPNVELFAVTTWEQYVSMVWSSFGGCNINCSPMGVGKVAAIAAYNRKISIGYMQQYQKMLYPELSSFDWYVLRRQLKKLVESPNFYTECAEKAHEQLSLLDMHNYQQLLLDFMESVINGRQKSLQP
tara:strand:+ start:4879 stop:5814 length:936 start_codon:yes stop_codon:yes gene_type:complete